jgi:hypothetical protein
VLRAAARLCLAVVLGAPAVLLSASPCRACTCAPRPPAQLLRRADAAFVGHVVGQDAIDPVTTVQTFAVSSLYKGPLGPTVQVIEPIGSGGGDTCGILYGAGEVAVILYRHGDGWTTDVCSRITPAQLAGVGPPPVHPRPAPSQTAAPTGPRTSETSGGLGWPSVILGVLLAVAAIAGVSSFAGRRDRRARSPGAGGHSEGPGSDPPAPSG